MSTETVQEVEEVFNYELLGMQLEGVFIDDLGLEDCE